MPANWCGHFVFESIRSYRLKSIFHCILLPHISTSFHLSIEFFLLVQSIQFDPSGKLFQTRTRKNQPQWAATQPKWKLLFFLCRSSGIRMYVKLEFPAIGKHCRRWQSTVIESHLVELFRYESQSIRQISRTNDWLPTVRQQHFQSVHIGEISLPIMTRRHKACCSAHLSELIFLESIYVLCIEYRSSALCSWIWMFENLGVMVFAKAQNWKA